MRQQDYMDVRESTDRATFESRLVRFAQAMDFGIVTAALAIERPGRSATFEVVGNVPQGFIEASRSFERTERDPVHKRLKSWHVPFSYDQNLYVEENAADLWESQAPWGYRTGIAMALHLPGGRHFLLGVDRPEPLPTDDAQLTRMVADLQLLAVYAQETANRVLAEPETLAEPLEKLSPREREVLQWTRDGKSSWAVGQILGLSEHSVNFHLRNACRKLGVAGKHMAVLKAISLRLI